MTTFQKVNRYKKIIQDYINKHPEKNSDDVLKHLLLRHIPLNKDSEQSLQALSKFRTTINPFFRELVKTLKNPEKNIIEVLDIYLKANPIKKNDDFFALLVAYFNSFEDLYTNKDLQNNTALYQQVIVPLHLYRERMEKDKVDLACELLERRPVLKYEDRDLNAINFMSPDYRRISSEYYENQRIKDSVRKDHRLACEMIRTMAIPKKELGRVITDLLKKIDSDDSLVYLIFETLGSLPIPKDQQSIVVTKLLEKVQNSKNRSDSEAAVKALIKIPIPKQQGEQVAGILLENIYSGTYDFRSLVPKLASIEGQLERVVTHAIETASKSKPSSRIFDNSPEYTTHRLACESLKILAGLPILTESLRERAVDVFLILAGYSDQQMYRPALEAFREMTIPESRHEKVVNKLLENVDSKDGIYCSYSCQALAVPTVFEGYHEKIINKLMEKIRDPNGKNIIYFCVALASMPLLEHQHDEVSNRLFELVDTKNSDDFGYTVQQAFRALLKMADSNEEYEKVAAKILEKLDSGDYRVKCSVCNVLRGAVLPERFHVRVVTKLLELIDGKDYTVMNNVCETLGKFPIPTSLVEQVVSKLLPCVDITSGHHSIDKCACEALGNISIPEHQHEVVFNKLYDRIDTFKGSFPQSVKPDACEAIGKINFNALQCPVIFYKLFMRVMNPDNVFETLNRDNMILNTLSALYNKMTPTERINIVARLESMQDDVASKQPNRLPFLLSVIQKCQSINAFSAGLLSHLPAEKAEDVRSGMVR
ncbi:MAG: hypothetical protein A3F11_00530 [Gammaproteobacteria bacterium RIFCSPHIGHO2_12_FULL_37_14]|nr:MAG: hypothetical protein A3F11_00530 [Gammaproteobacteria bacterium RIFCSPHIGHO2_12_FULL_37_14]